MRLHSFILPLIFILISVSFVCSSPAVRDDGGDDDMSVPPPLFGGAFTKNLPAASTVVIIISSLCVSAGIGGGSLLVATYILVYQQEITPYAVHNAVPLSQAAITGLAFTNFILLFRYRHPFADRPLVDWQVLSLVVSGVVLGSSFGVLINTIMPAWALAIIIVLMIGFISSQTGKKALQTWRREKEEMSASKEQNASLFVSLDARATQGGQRRANLRGSITSVRPGEVATVDMDLAGVRDVPSIVDEAKRFSRSLSTQLRRTVTEDNSKSSELMTSSRSSLATNLLAEDSLRDTNMSPHEDVEASIRSSISLLSKCHDESRIPLENVGLCLLTWAGVTASAFGKKAVECGGPVWWILQLGVAPYCGVILFFVKKTLERRDFLRKESGAPPVEGDIEWNSSACIQNALMSIFGGVLAGLIGNGGGVVIGPLLLHLGVLPQVATATSGILLSFASSSTLLQFVAVKRIRYDSGLWFAACGSIGAIVGRLAVTKIVMMTGRPSLLIWLLTALLAGSACVFGALAVIQAFDEVHEQGHVAGFAPLCSK